MDTFIKLVRARGHSLRVEYDRTIVTVSDVDKEIFIRERLKIVKSPDGNRSRKLQPTGKLVFKMKYDDKEWQDGRNLLEDKLPRIMATIELKTQELKEIWRVDEERRRKEEEKRQMERMERERKEKEREDFKLLLNQATRWKQAKILRKYIRRVRKNAIKKDNLTDDLKNWINWANQKADWYDPFNNREDTLLNDADKRIFL